jgi:hypothetical protein
MPYTYQNSWQPKGELPVIYSNVPAKKERKEEEEEDTGDWRTLSFFHWIKRL